MGPHPGLGTAISYLVACPGLLPGVLASILPRPPRGQFVIYLESEGIFKDVNQVTILTYKILQGLPVVTQMKPQHPRSLPTFMTSSPLPVLLPT